MHRAYSLLDVKSVEQDTRTFRGIATTPSPDRMNDRVNSMKATYAAEIPLLHGHRADSPIGVVRLGKATKSGIPFEASIPVIHEPPTLKERVEVAFGEIVHGLVRAVSIGFRSTEPPKLNDKGGVDFEGIEILELSTVAIPAQAEALIHTIKGFDEAAMREAGIDPIAADEEFRNALRSAASGQTSRVVKLGDRARDRAPPFIIRQIKRT